MEIGKETTCGAPIVSYCSPAQARCERLDTGLKDLLEFLVRWFGACGGAHRFLGTRVRDGRPHSQARMVGGEVFLDPQRPETAKKREDGGPGQLQIAVTEDFSSPDPCIDSRERASQGGVEWLRGVQIPKPAAERGRVGHAIGILHRRCRRFPRTVLDKVAPQRFTAGDQAVMRIRERKPRQEGNRFAARSADTSPDFDPVVVFIMSLFAAATMANDRVQQTNRALADELFCACFGPLGFRVALPCGK